MAGGTRTVADSAGGAGPGGGGGHVRGPGPHPAEGDAGLLRVFRHLRGRQGGPAAL